MKLQERLRHVPDPRGRQGQDYPLWALLNLIIVGFLCGRRGLLAVHRLGRSLTASQQKRLGFMNGRTPCHGTLTETLRLLPPEDLIAVLDYAVEGGPHIATEQIPKRWNHLFHL